MMLLNNNNNQLRQLLTVFMINAAFSPKWWMVIWLLLLPHSPIHTREQCLSALSKRYRRLFGISGLIIVGCQPCWGIDSRCGSGICGSSGGSGGWRLPFVRSLYFFLISFWWTNARLAASNDHVTNLFILISEKSWRFIALTFHLLEVCKCVCVYYMCKY